MTIIEVTRDRGREVFSYVRGMHYPRPARRFDGKVVCADCLQRLRTYPDHGRRWRHYSGRRPPL